jgi:SP family myo-inositol transporter-like MFS transporter 13
MAIWLAALVAFANFACTLLGMAAVERLGRRRLVLGSLAGVVAALVLLGGLLLPSTTAPRDL